MDETIWASLLVVGGTLLFFGGLGWFVMKDIKDSENKPQ
jgi:hypothetical protein